MQIQIKNRNFKTEICKGPSAALGFMFHPPSMAKVLAFNKESRISLHMLFVFFPLLAVFLDSRKRVVELKVLKPFAFYTSRQKVKFVIEIPMQLAKSLKVSIGDKIKFISEQKFKG